MSLLPQIHKTRKHKNVSSLKIFQQNPQNSEFSGISVDPVLAKNRNKLTQYRYSQPRTYQQMINQTDNIIAYLQSEQQKPSTKIRSKPHDHNYHRKAKSQHKNHKLIYENQVNLRTPSVITSKISRTSHNNISHYNHNYGDINRISKIITKRSRTQTQPNAKVEDYMVLVPKPRKKYLVLEDQLIALRNLTHVNRNYQREKKIRDQSILKKFRQKQKQKQKQKQLGKQPIRYKYTKTQKVEAMLAYDTVYFRKIKDQMWNENAEKLLGKNGIIKPKKKKQQYEYTIRFPTLPEIERLIAGYQPLTQHIRIDLLIREGNRYFREYRDDDDKQYLYFGQHNQLKERNGKGVLVTPFRILEGIWERGDIKEGAELQRKFKYKGTFYKNKKHGHGEFQSVSGEKYKGEWVYNKRHGHGEWISENGESYVGDWAQGKAEGYGVYLNLQGDRYKGEFKDYLKSGLGKQQLANGDIFQGQFQQGYPHGKGKYTWKNGLHYQGRFVNGIRVGYGRIKYQGLFQFNGHFQKQKPVITEDSIILHTKNTTKQKKTKPYFPSIPIPREAIAYRPDNTMTKIPIAYNAQQSFYETEQDQLSLTQTQN